MLQGNVLFGQISQARIDEFQHREEYAECYRLYEASSLDSYSPNLRSMKMTLYQVLRDFLIYDPVLDNCLGFSNWEQAVSVFDQIDIRDPDYANKMTAVLSVLYYCVKNRGYNYALAANASHDEVRLAEFLRDWLENHSVRIINGSPQVAGVLAALMVLLYDKVGTATVQLVHIGRDVPVGIDFRNTGNGHMYGEIEYRNTTSKSRSNALELIGMDQYRQEYGIRRNYWRNIVQNQLLRESENTFLYGCCDVAQINQFLSRYQFRVYDICTQYYENYYSKSPSPFFFFKQMFFLLTGRTEKYDSERRKNRELNEYSLKQIIMSHVKTVIPSFAIIAVASILCERMYGDEGKKILAIVLLVTVLFFTSPFYNRSLEKKKRKKYSIYSW